MKKLLIGLLFPFVAATLLMLCGFTDLPEDHWAYDAVNRLVEEGTVTGFEDGSFRPGEPVTRVQFVKMLGYRTEKARNDYITDLDGNHWGFEYLLYSPLRTVGRELLPDEVMTREQVAVYVYDCYAGGAETTAPSIITKGLEYADEVGWVYEHGVMIGDDGLHLRLSDGLTRAEAAVLIANSRDKMTSVCDFVDNISDEVLARVFEDSALFDTAYQKDAVLTNGQIARAANRLRLGAIAGLWYNDNEKADFDHPYANDLKVFEPILGSGRISAAFADAEAMPEDAFAMLAYGMVSKVKTPVPYGALDDYYADAQLADDALNAPLTFAYERGIRPFGGGVLKTGVPVTHRTAAAVLLQYDMLYGLATSVSADGITQTEHDEPMRYGTLPACGRTFEAVLENVPNAVYDAPYRTAEGEIFAELALSPRVNYAFCNDLRRAFGSYLGNVASSIAADTGVRFRFTYYPQLVYDNLSGMSIRIKAEVVEAEGDGVTAAYLFGGYLIDGVAETTVSPAEALSVGNVLWLEVPLSYTFFAG